MLLHEELIEALVAGVLPLLPAGDQATLRSDIERGDYEYAIDTFMQFTLLEIIPFPTDLLEQIEDAMVNEWAEPELLDHAYGWLNQHKASADRNPTP